MQHPSRLSKYYRKPGMTIKLPTGGAYLANASMGSEIDILPMTASDEIMLTNPDLLMSGRAIEELIRSCAPNAGNPSDIPAPDVDAILLAIRAASFGDKMNIDTECPECTTEQTFDLDILPILNSIQDITEEHTHVRLDQNLVVVIRPYNYGDMTKFQLATFVETRKVQTLEVNEATEEALQAQMNETMISLTMLKNGISGSCIVAIIDEDGAITDRQEISDFYSNIPRAMSSKIEKAIENVNKMGVDRDIQIQCSNKECNHVWTTQFEFDNSAFSEPAS